MISSKEILFRRNVISPLLLHRTIEFFCSINFFFTLNLFKNFELFYSIIDFQVRQLHAKI